MTAADLEIAPRRRRKRLTAIELGEVSIVTAPANPAAFHLLHKSVATEAAPMIDQAALDQLARDAVGKVLAQMDQHVAGATRAVARFQGGVGGVDKAGGPAGSDTLDTALALAREGAAARARERGDDKPTPGFWRQALQQLGQRLAPDAPPSAQMTVAMQSREGRFLVAQMLGDDRALVRGG